MAMTYSYTIELYSFSNPNAAMNVITDLWGGETISMLGEVLHDDVMTDVITVVMFDVDRSSCFCRFK